MRDEADRAGPFELSEYEQNEKTVVTKNPDYWQQGFPKAHQITFVPVPETSSRVVQLQGGQLDVMHTDNGLIIDQLRSLGGEVKLLTQKPGYREVALLLPAHAATRRSTTSTARQAFAAAIDRKTIAEIRTKGVFDLVEHASWTARRPAS